MAKGPECWSFETEIGGPPPPPVRLRDDGSAQFLQPFTTASMRWSRSGDTLRIFSKMRWPWSLDIFVRGASQRNAPTEIVNGTDAPMRGRKLETRYRAKRISCGSVSWPADEPAPRDPNDPWQAELYDQPPRLENKREMEKAVYEKWRMLRDMSNGETLAFRFLIDATGKARARLDAPSDDGVDVMLQIMANELASLARFSPAQLSGQSVD